MKVPTQVEIDDDITKILKRLNAKVDLRSKDDLVYESLVKCWTNRKGSPPIISEVADTAGIHRQTIASVMRRLINLGKVKKLTNGVYIPLGGKNG